MSDTSGFGKLVPGFDFLQSLVKSAGSTLPGIGQWVAPTLDPAELDKRIGELRTVQYWLEQNARMLAATIQALEVQRMTLSTLKSMNVQMGDLSESLKIKPEAKRPSRDDEARASAAAPSPSSKKAAAPKPAAGAVDPMQWWGALTNQFAELATSAMKDSAADAAKSLAGGMMKQSFDAAAETMKQVAGAPGRAMAGAARSMAPKAAGDAPAKKAARRAPKRRRPAPPAT
ncbi:MAG TPA: PhaM family polyhydroxyalkanoate granule multifunctional regulatory protein [Caldimonas sp.]|nr:PhaM family polyhydroxyalkanoate granule multifunctional regulatory protein [Caldimonas sp.]